MLQLAPRPSQPDIPQYGLVSLWDMIRIQLEHYITLGSNIATLRRMLDSPEELGAYGKSGSKVFSPNEAILAVVGQLRGACSALDLPTALATIDQTMMNFQHHSQIAVMLWAVQAEMTSRLFLHIPAERSKFWENNDLPLEKARAVFPSAASEIRSAGTAYACGLWNASVFHSMRAAEDALTAICDELDISRNGAEQWGNLIERIESKLKAVTQLPKANDEKRQNLQPLSELVIDLRLFKDAWRNQNSHTIVAYNDGNAHSIIHAVCRVLDALASRGGVSAKITS